MSSSERTPGLGGLPLVARPRPGSYFLRARRIRRAPAARARALTPDAGSISGAELADTAAQTPMPNKMRPPIRGMFILYSFLLLRRIREAPCDEAYGNYNIERRGLQGWDRTGVVCPSRLVLYVCSCPGLDGSAVPMHRQRRGATLAR